MNSVSYPNRAEIPWSSDPAWLAAEAGLSSRQSTQQAARLCPVSLSAQATGWLSEIEVLTALLSLRR